MTQLVFGSEEANRIAAGQRPRQVVTAGGLIEFSWWPDAPSIYATETQPNERPSRRRSACGARALNVVR
jgi:hypothetical protein